MNGERPSLNVTVEVAVGPAPQGALALEDFEAADEFADAIREALLKTSRVSVVLARTPGTLSALPSIPEAFEVLLAAVGGFPGGQARVFVVSEQVRARLVAMLRSDRGDAAWYRCGAWTLLVHAGDITAVVADAVVNASNTRLQLGSGVSGALRRVCGPGLQAELNRLGGVTEAGMAVTGAHRLGTTRTILHVPTASGRAAVVRSGLDNVLRYCRDKALASVAVPALGAGTGGLEVQSLAELCVAALRENPAPDFPCKVIFVLWDDLAFVTFERVFDAAFGPSSRPGEN